MCKGNAKAMKDKKNLFYFAIMYMVKAIVIIFLCKTPLNIINATDLFSDKCLWLTMFYLSL